MYVCAKCGKDETEVEFATYNNGRKKYKRTVCKGCKQQYQNEWRSTPEQKAKTKQRYADNKETIRQRNKLGHIELRKKVLNHYGSFCQCCGEHRYEFLSVDHIEGNGIAHKKEVGAGTNFYRWIIKNGFPTNLRILCHNCNQALGYYKICPHQLEKEQELCG